MRPAQSYSPGGASVVCVGRALTNATGLSTLLSLRNALIVSVKDPQPGVWTLELAAQSAHTVRVTGLSAVDFVHGFSARPTLALNDTQPQPTRGQHRVVAPSADVDTIQNL